MAIMKQQLLSGAPGRYWLKVFALYALAEAAIQLIFFTILNNFGKQPISLIELHGLMWLFQCGLIWPIWWVAAWVRKKALLVQVLVNIGFYIVYTYLWFGPVQDMIGWLYQQVVTVTRPPGERLTAVLDKGNEYAYFNYQLLKHAFRLSWFYLAAYFFHYRREEEQRVQLAIANRSLQLKMLKWHLNPGFYFNTIHHLRSIAATNPSATAEPILKLARVMEYVIYEAKEKLISIKKELQFLENYIGLRNHQGGNTVRTTLETPNDPEQLKIAPLLLTGIIDHLAPATGNEPANYHLQVSFREATLCLSFSGKQMHTLNSHHQPLQRLNELYAGRFQVQQNEQLFSLEIQLDAGT